MAPQPEAAARQEIDQLLTQAGWAVQSMAQANLHAAQGVAIREFPLNTGHGFADYLLYADAKACGVVKTQRQGTPQRGVEAAVAEVERRLSAVRSVEAQVDANLKRAQSPRQAVQTKAFAV